MRTAKRMGIECVAVYSEPDRKCKHVQMADKAYLIGPAQSTKSYLDMNKILSVCLDAKVDAVHPGYGFLSENSKFMDLLDQNGIKFIGPKKRAINDLGDKINSKKLAGNAGVNLIPGYIGEVSENREEILKIAHQIGYPVMIKPSAGGGGKGMRIAYTDDEIIENFRLSKQEAASSFGDDRILLEKYIEEPRHIEINVLGDSHGNVIYLPERECSIQRRNQKVLEEAPSPFIDEETRKMMGKQAVQLAKAVDYESAGTVEFMVDKYRKFYFLEMNTRLQVEHPITEMITGIDLVEEMINVANGKKLSYTQDQVKIKGHAVESRVYAEDPFRGFLPSIGHLIKYREPSHPNIRIDTGVREGDEISMHYDPLISKTITWAETRQGAIDLMKTALDTYVIRGLGHNVPFCRDVLRQPAFVSGKYSTKFIPLTYPDGFHPSPLSQGAKNDLATIIASMKEITDSFALKKPEKFVPFVIKAFDEFYAIQQNEKGEKTILKIDTEGNGIGEETVLQQVKINWNNTDPLISGEVGGKTHHIQFFGHTATGYQLFSKGQSINVDILNAHQFEFQKWMPKATDAHSQKEALAPMPGSVISVAVQPGQKVEVGQELCVLEAMKMRNIIRSEKKGVVKVVSCSAGQSVQVDQVLFEYE
eukprot:CAMPEP_0202946914 /NCGR_PEP_ID=MMETSP1395-20130829/10390_1 /ASSEMBLY_ACC=CAM_ASM_000871 /TAXON_ID=5961 /ORGANISM="Blepharisma japonicum, Strain Stock R1072" /LENGTH=646 /DNA_ID=CAMNT_0049647805 /DNA_START=60 /DNA_END=2000 /DNA_ORIENTATION=+